ncbi:DUF6193 family natural product biosynthesis protein [Streptomyces sp. MK7]
MTMDVYTHVVGDSEREAVGMLAEPLEDPLIGTGMGELHFSRCTEPRWTWDIPYIAPGAKGTYWVLGPLRSEWVGQVATVQEAITLVVDRLPPACGPAFMGTPEELAAHEATKPGQQKGDAQTQSG